MADSRLREQLLNLEMAGPRAEPKLHKPLLVAMLLRKFIADGSTSVAFTDIEKEANALIGRFVSSSSPPRAQYPFWRLRHDGFWEIDGAANLELNASGDPKITDLRSPNHRGRWSAAAAEELRASGGEGYLELVLDRYFPENKQAVRDALGLHAEATEVQTHQPADVTTVSVDGVPVEAVEREQSEFERAASGMATQREAQLTARFELYLRAHGRVVRRYRITTPGSSSLYSDLADTTGNVLYEAKGSADRMSVRLALGQVLDYGRYVPSSRLAVLLPEAPPADMVELLEAYGVGCVVETTPNRFADATRLRRCP